MTGIERALFEDRMAEERAAAIGAAEARAACRDGRHRSGRRERRRRARDGSGRDRGAIDGACRVPNWGRAAGPSLALLVLPLVGAGAAWGLAVMLDRMPNPGTDLGRLTALALVLAGPATTVGAIMARVWWPRLVAVVVAGGLAAAVFVGRALLG